MGMLSGFIDDQGKRRRRSGADVASAGGEGLDESVIFEIISNDRRRYTLQVLHRADREMYLRELAERVAAIEHGKPRDALTTRERRSVETALRQFHLPKMADSEFVEYNKHRKTVTLVVSSCVLSEYLGPTVRARISRRVLLAAACSVALSGYLSLLLVEIEVHEVALAAAPLLLGVVLFFVGALWSTRLSTATTTPK